MFLFFRLSVIQIAPNHWVSALFAWNITMIRCARSHLQSIKLVTVLSTVGWLGAEAMMLRTRIWRPIHVCSSQSWMKKSPGNVWVTSFCNTLVSLIENAPLCEHFTTHKFKFVVVSCAFIHYFALMRQTFEFEFNYSTLSNFPYWQIRAKKLKRAIRVRVGIHANISNLIYTHQLLVIRARIYFLVAV